MVIDKYVSLCPEFVKKENFYLQSLSKPAPACWYAKEVLGEGSIGKIMGKMMTEAGYEGFYSGHSLRHTGSTRLFQAGVQRKIVKECTGHRSNVVYKYQITSEDQRETVSKILASKPVNVQSQTASEIKNLAGNAIDPRVVYDSDSSKVPPPNEDHVSDVISVRESCSCKHSEMSGLLEHLISAVKKKGKGKIKIEIEISKD